VLSLEEIDLNQLIKNMEKMLNPLIGENVTIRTVFGRDVKPVLADRGQVEQVIMNLVVNSRDALPRGGKIIIKTADCFVSQDDTHLVERIKPGPYTQLIVSDNGTGIDRETLGKIFEPFFTTKERGKGTGLGLSTVFGIVKQSGGCVDVESEPGKGTTFCIYLPQIPKPAKKTKTESKAQSSEKLTGDETILLVEDDEEFVKVAAKMIGRYGYTVFSAKSGAEALALLTDGAHEHIGLVITDVIMPGMSGRELAEEIEKIIPAMRVLYISGYTGTEISIEKIVGKSVSFLQKPFSAPEFAAKVREVLDDSTATHAANAKPHRADSRG
jgi:two-component system cell cycle sensor histidine kinase/response regulator CckA